MRYIIMPFIFLFLLMALPAEGAKPTITEISDAPWMPAPPVARPKVIYGEDDRIDVYQETDPIKLAWADSTCALVYTSRLTQHADGSYTISSPAAYRRFGLPPCEGEPFGDQPTAAYCSAFMVGPDLIATAGHCYNSASFADTRFIFGFYMEDETTPRLHFHADEVYQGVQIVSYSPSGALDHCIVRVDRPIRAPGARPFKVRREGVVAPGEFVGVIGHPSGLPMKIAFGNTYVRRSNDAGYFVANLDTYGGNSGSPVINAGTGILEGILVRGETDFIHQGTCFVSNVVANDGGRGEDCTKATVFAQHVPDGGSYSGVITFDNTHYACGATIALTVVDLDLVGMEMIAVSLETSGGDAESVLLVEDPNQIGRFSGSVETTPEAPVPGSGVLEAGHGDVVTAVYMDEENDAGDTVEVEVSALIDCYPPLIFGVQVSFLGTTQAQLKFNTDEPAAGMIRYGTACQNLAFLTTGPTATAHTISLSGLSPGTRYYFAVEARDRAGNTGFDDGGGACYSLVTYSTQNHFTEYFNTSNTIDIRNRQVSYIPIDHPDRYQACVGTAAELPVPASGQILALEDDGFVEILLPEGKSFSFYGVEYDSFFIGSNGYITFGTGDATYQAVPSQHFLLPRISALMCDLNPALRGSVYLAQMSDRYVVTFEGVPVFDGTGAYPPENSHTFQLEMFLNGIIRITWVEIAAVQAVVGLSAGIGTPINFSSIKITQIVGCDDIVHDGTPHSADINGDWQISLEELLRVIQLYNSHGYSCNSGSPDGYQTGDGPRDCMPHDSDYITQDWKISLSELLRLIQLYNVTGYRPAAASEDGFQAIP